MIVKKKIQPEEETTGSCVCSRSHQAGNPDPLTQWISCVWTNATIFVQSNKDSKFKGFASKSIKRIDRWHKVHGIFELQPTSSSLTHTHTKWRKKRGVHCIIKVCNCTVSGEPFFNRALIKAACVPPTFLHQSQHGNRGTQSTVWEGEKTSNVHFYIWHKLSECESFVKTRKTLIVSWFFDIKGQSLHTKLTRFHWDFPTLQNPAT